MLIGVEALRVDASIANNVAEGFRDESSSAAEVSIQSAAVHQVLWTQRNQDPCLLLHLTLQSPYSAERPARPTHPLET